MVCNTTRPILDALVNSRREWISLEEIATSTGYDPYAVDVIVDSLVKNGYLDVWRKKSGPVLTFSVWGAYQLGYRLTENGAKNRNRFRWIKAKKKRKSELDLDPPRRRRPRENAPPPIEEVAVDPLPTPDVVAAQAEEEAALEVEKQERKERRGLPLRPEDVARPTILLTGHSGFPWQETDDGGEPSGFCPKCNLREVKGNKYLRADCKDKLAHGSVNWRRGECPGCQGRELTRSMFCLRCRRWGWDRYFRLGEYSRRKHA